MFSFKDLRSTLGNVRFADDTFFREAGLQTLSRRFESYPSTFEGNKIYVLVPRGMDPRNAQRMEEAEAVGKMIVLMGTKNHWSKAWPAAPEAPKKEEAAEAPDLIITDD
jgi:hypothetical protein